MAGASGGGSPAGATGATGATGPAGPMGATGPAGPLPATLPSGQTLRGYVSPIGMATAAFQLTQASVSFPFPLAAAPVAHFIKFGTANPAGCTGTGADPQANPGHLCVYESQAAINVQTARGITGPAGDDTASRFGFSGWATSAASSFYGFYATWAVTAA